MVLHYWSFRIKDAVITFKSDEDRSLMFIVSDVLQLPQQGTKLLLPLYL